MSVQAGSASTQAVTDDRFRQRLQAMGVEHFEVATLAEVRTIISRFIPRRHATLLVGETAIGKTSTALEIARAEAEMLGKIFVQLETLIQGASEEEREERLRPILENPDKYYITYLLKLGGVFPEEVIGRQEARTITYRDPKTGERRTMLVRTELLDATLLLFSIPGIHGCLILDDVTHIIYPNIENLVATFVQERKLGCASGAPSLSENVRIIATGNLPEHTEHAKPLPRHMTGRFSVWLVVPHDVTQWIEIMRNIHGERFSNTIIAYLLRYKEDFHVPEAIHPVLRVGPTPRAFEKAGEALWFLENDPQYAKNPRMMELVLQSYLGPLLAKKIVEFATKRLPSVEEFLESPENVIPMLRNDMDIACRFVTEVVSKLEFSVTKGALEGEQVRIKLPNRRYYIASKNDPNVYIYALTRVMNETTTDYGVMALKSMGTKAKEAVRDFLSKQLLQPKNPGEEAWYKALNEARSTIYNLLITLGIVSALEKASRS